MDYLRLGYKTKAKLGLDYPEPVTISWFRCSPEAPLFSRPHSFGSLVWSGRQTEGKIGERLVPLTATAGTPIGLYSVFRPCPDPNWLVTGVPAGAMPLPWNPLTETPLCCSSPGTLLEAQLGLALDVNYVVIDN